MHNLKINFAVVDNSEDIISILEERLPGILTAVGLKAQEHAVKNIVNSVYKKNSNENSDYKYKRTGRAMRSITQTVTGGKVYVGSNLKYFPYLELGTGIHASDGNGRRGYWVYVPGQEYERKGEKKIYTLQQAIALAEMLRKQGLDAHVTNGIKPSHAIRNSISEHMDEYKKIVEDGLKDISI